MATTQQINSAAAEQAKVVRTPFVHRLQGWGAALSFGALGLLPLDWASALGGALARRIGPSLGISERARRNLRRAFPGLPEIEIERIVAGMWDNLGRVAAEYPHLREIRVFEAGGRVETHGLEHMDRAVAAGRRMIIFSGHIANWAIGVLRRGAHLTMLADQKMNDGIAVPFFGRPAMTTSALASLALRFECDVLPARVERLGGARFRLTVFPPLPLPRSGDHHADIAALMSQVNSILEEWVRNRP